MTNVPLLRPATASDIPALAETNISAANFSIPGRKLGEELFDLERDIAPAKPDGSPPGKLRLQLEDRLSKGHIWLAELDGQVVGSIAWDDPSWSAEQGYEPGEITSMAVHPSYHSRGIGTMLLNHAKHVSARVKEMRGIDSEVLIQVRCFEKNPRALAFYERAGFERRHGAEEWHEKVGEYLALLELLK
ncbi:GNAT family N-acetyltransferase [Mycena venus]|uniref:GNAT family N-acetyltransferase n=1 Tax=Mycena venus TaxID=2733690 RepID=A0A8H6X1X3_9AGAR|nr:GNAT family N-acetyltransferase [Mycena venus]